MNTQHEALFHIVKHHFDLFDPFDLLCIAPPDEYDTESLEISKKVTQESTISDIAVIISEVITFFFYDKYTPLDCLAVAKNIYNDIHNL